METRGWLQASAGRASDPEVALTLSRLRVLRRLGRPHRGRKFVARSASLHDLVGPGSLTEQTASFLHASARAGLNVLAAGMTQADRSTF